MEDSLYGTSLHRAEKLSTVFSHRQVAENVSFPMKWARTLRRKMREQEITEETENQRFTKDSTITRGVSLSF
jgi:hypothetical protein